MPLSHDEVKSIIKNELKKQKIKQIKKSRFEYICNYLESKSYQIENESSTISTLTAYLQEYTIEGKKHNFPKEYEKYRKIKDNNINLYDKYKKEKNKNEDDVNLNKICNDCGTNTIKFIKTIYPSGDEAAKQVYKCSKCGKQIVTS